MSLQSIAAKIMFKLPDPILGKIMKFISPKKEPQKLDQKNIGIYKVIGLPSKKKKALMNLR